MLPFVYVRGTPFDGSSVGIVWSKLRRLRHLRPLFVNDEEFLRRLRFPFLLFGFSE